MESTPKDAVKCTCVYATSDNTPAVRSGHEMGGYLKEECLYCRERKFRHIEVTKERMEEIASWLDQAADSICHWGNHVPSYFRTKGRVGADILRFRELANEVRAELER